MENAIHSNMESNIDEDLVDTFRTTMKFKCQTDIHTKRINDEDNDVTTDNNMNDANGIDNTTTNNHQDNSKEQNIDPDQKKY